MSTDKMTLGEILQAAEDYHAAMDDGELLGYRTVAEWLNDHPSAALPGLAGAIEAFKSNVPWRASARRNRIAAVTLAPKSSPSLVIIDDMAPQGAAVSPSVGALRDENERVHTDLREAVRTIVLLREDVDRLAKQSESWESAARSNRRQIDLGVKAQAEKQAKLDAAYQLLQAATAERDAAREANVPVQALAGQRDAAQARAKRVSEINDQLTVQLREAAIARGKAEQERASVETDLRIARAERDEARRERDGYRSTRKINDRAIGNVPGPVSQTRAIMRAVGAVQHHRKDRLLSGEARIRADVMAVFQSIHIEAGLDVPEWLAVGCKTGQTPDTIGDLS